MDERPWIFEDQLARRMLAQEEIEFYNRVFVEQFLELESAADATDRTADELLAGFMRTAAAPAEMLTRQRYAESNLEAAIRDGIRQYVVLGAGMDTYALRNPEAAVRIYEIDRPIVQEFKRKRIAEAGLNSPKILRYVAVNFERKGLYETLGDTDFDRSVPTFFSWLGVTMYLSYEAIGKTLQDIRRSSATGSQVVFDYLSSEAFDPKKSSKAIQSLAARLEALGEPLYRNFEPDRLKGELSAHGFDILENLSPSAIDGMPPLGAAFSDCR